MSSSFSSLWMKNGPCPAPSVRLAVHTGTSSHGGASNSPLVPLVVSPDELSEPSDEVASLDVASLEVASLVSELVDVLLSLSRLVVPVELGCVDVCVFVDVAAVVVELVFDDAAAVVVFAPDDVSAALLVESGPLDAAGLTSMVPFSEPHAGSAAVSPVAAPTLSTARRCTRASPKVCPAINKA